MLFRSRTAHEWADEVWNRFDFVDEDEDEDEESSEEELSWTNK